LNEEENSQLKKNRVAVGCPTRQSKLQSFIFRPPRPWTGLWHVWKFSQTWKVSW